MADSRGQCLGQCEPVPAKACEGNIPLFITILILEDFRLCFMCLYLRGALVVAKAVAHWVHFRPASG